MPAVARILDANANRAREALRVMEETARFLLEDAALARDLKSLRHDLAAVLERLPSAPGAVELHRNTPGDVGTTIKTKREKSRASVAAVAVAAGKRLSEALRVLEEYAKLLPAPAGKASGGGGGGRGALAIESLRYRGYDLELRLHQALRTGVARPWRLCVLLSASLCRGARTHRRGDWWAVAQACVTAAADMKRGGDLCLQLREKELEAAELLTRTRKLVTLCHPHGVTLIVNDRPDVALLGGADGVHLGQGDLPCREARRLVGRQLLIGVSTSNLAQGRAALRDGADYCGVGPMFPTTTKHKDVIVGPRYLRQYQRTIGNQLPGLAIGGINLDNVDTLIRAGAAGVAVSSAVCAAADPAKVVRAFLRRFPRS